MEPSSPRTNARGFDTMSTIKESLDKINAQKKLIHLPLVVSLSNLGISKSRGFSASNWNIGLTYHPILHQPSPIKLMNKTYLKDLELKMENWVRRSSY